VNHVVRARMPVREVPIGPDAQRLVTIAHPGRLFRTARLATLTLAQRQSGARTPIIRIPAVRRSGGEDKVRRFFTPLPAVKDDEEEFRSILVKLWDALHQRIERLRARFCRLSISSLNGGFEMGFPRPMDYAGLRRCRGFK
jgi:hypothetical protein